jgi:hypothetical protein
MSIVSSNQSSRVSRTAGALGLSALIALTLVTPVVIPATNALHNAAPLPPTYLPALEGPRERGAFEQTRITDLQRMQPGYVVIGDSMAGTRVDDRRLGELTGVPIAPLLQAGSGSAFWYLALKNWVIASGIRPRMILMFFRDDNLTDVLFRLDQQFRWALDLAATDHEDELNAAIARRLGPLHRVHGFVDSTMGAEQARKRLEAGIADWPASVMIPSRRRREEFMTQMNIRFGLDHLRTMEAADIQIGDEPSFDFARDVDRSALPLMLRDAKAAGLTICFVRVQRRPTANRPPAQSPSLVRYVRDLEQYVTARGGLFHDDTGDPAMTLDLYADGDHLARNARRFYTETLYNRLRQHFQ